RLTAAWARHNNQPIPPRNGTREATERPSRGRDDASDRSTPPATVQLQVSWVPGRVVAWAAGGGESHVDSERLAEMLAASSAPGAGWPKHEPVSVPGGAKADALSIP